MNIDNLEYIRSLKSAEFPDLGVKLAEALQSLGQQHDTLAQQMNGNGLGNPTAPPAINGLKVTGQNGHFNIAVQDQNQIYRGIRYYAEYDTDKNFSNPTTVPMGDSRNHNIFLGNGTYYWRAYSAYLSSPAGPAAYHGSQGEPLPVSGGGSVGGPARQASQGSGTGAPGQGLQGPGGIPFRSATGAPPVRSNAG